MAVTTNPDSAPAGTAQRLGRPAWWMWLVGAAGLVVGGVVVWQDSAELGSALSSLGSVQPLWVLAMIAAQVGNYTAYGASEAVLLRAGGEPLPLPPVVAQAVASQAVADCLPGGAALSTVFSYRQLRLLGARRAVSTWVLAANSVLYIVVLAVLTLAGGEIAGPAARAGIPDLAPFAGAVFLIGVALVVAAAVLSRRDLLRPVLVAAAGSAGRPFGRADRSRAAVTRWLDSMGAFQPRWRDWLASAGLLAVSWLLDAACLALAFPAIGEPVPWRGLLLAYGAAQLAASLPISPGGLGVVEGSLTVALVAYGGSSSDTLVAVLLYRLISFWGILPFGLASWGALHVRARRRPRLSGAVA